MGDNSAIQWTDATWNPVLGCSRVSDGCTNCYAIRDAHRLAGNPNPKIGPVYAGLTARRKDRLDWTGVVRLLPERLELPLRWKRPRRVFVNSQSDLFHPSLSEVDISRVFFTMARCPQHTFQVLTKRPERMRAVIASLGEIFPTSAMGYPWPLPNCWLGVSCEDQATANERIPPLLATPAAVRFLSCEPLLGPITLTDASSDWSDDLPLSGLDWCIVGGESGPGARPCDLRWIENLVDECGCGGVAPFVKQLGEHWSRSAGAHDRHGGDPAEWPPALQVRQWPAAVTHG